MTMESGAGSMTGQRGAHRGRGQPATGSSPAASQTSRNELPTPVRDGSPPFSRAKRSHASFTETTVPDAVEHGHLDIRTAPDAGSAVEWVTWLRVHGASELPRSDTFTAPATGGAVPPSRA